jgi:ATP-dependent DNA helicase RecG
MHQNFLETPVIYSKGVGPARADLLKEELGIFTFNDLLSLYPFRYLDRTKFHNIFELTGDSGYVQIKGKIGQISTIGKGRSFRLVVRFYDNSGDIELIWFNGAKWLLDKLMLKVEFIVFGKPSFFNGKLNITHPDIEPFDKLSSKDLLNYLAPIYSSTEKLKSAGLDSRGISKVIRNILLHTSREIPEILSETILKGFKLTSEEKAVCSIHFPENQLSLNEAIRRLKFNELFFIQLRVLMLKHFRNVKLKGHIFSSVGTYLNTFYNEKLPFELTNAQKRVIKEIRKDIGSGRQMNRLLQGDVGSGKTIVALMCMLIALDNGFQACIMAPTEILAIQHYNTIKSLLISMDINVQLLTGSTKSKKRKNLIEGLCSGDIHILVGTHSLIEDVVVFKNLGFAVIDEQHRFGVVQRAKLWKKGLIPPHILVMTATPIPRTLAMTLYGDLDVSVIDELPKGRNPVRTMHFKDSNRLKVWGFIREQIRNGRQIYIVYPLINESETLDLKHLKEGWDAVVRDFPLPEYAVSMVHGQLKAKEKDYEMARFVKGETQIMVATTVIEVGVDIPNASVMIIENAERFGLSQLHQLRGRVGRGADQSYCILMTADFISQDAKLRISTMLETNDGFRISETDLKLRGPGNIEGVQQSGILDLHLADIVADEELLKLARQAVIELLESDPELTLPVNKPVKEYILSENKRKGNWSMIS